MNSEKILSCDISGPSFSNHYFFKRVYGANGYATLKCVLDTVT